MKMKPLTVCAQKVTKQHKPNNHRFLKPDTVGEFERIWPLAEKSGLTDFRKSRHCVAFVMVRLCLCDSLSKAGREAG